MDVIASGDFMERNFPYALLMGLSKKTPTLIDGMVIVVQTLIHTCVKWIGLPRVKVIKMYFIHVDVILRNA